MSPFLLYVWVCVYVCMYSCVSIYMLKKLIYGYWFFFWYEYSGNKTREGRLEVLHLFFYFYFYEKIDSNMFFEVFHDKQKQTEFLIDVDFEYLITEVLEQSMEKTLAEWCEALREYNYDNALYRKRYMAVSFIMRTLWIFWKTIILLQKHWNKYIWCDLISKILTLALWLEF